MYATFNRKKIIFYAVSLIAATALIAVVIAVLSSHTLGGSADDMNAVCVSFLKEKKVKLAEKTPQSIETTVIAKDFSDVLLEYNELQKKQGFDLSGYAGKTVIKYTYGVNDKERGDIVAVVFVYGGKIIGGDVHCIGADGYMTGFDGEKV